MRWPDFLFQFKQGFHNLQMIRSGSVNWEKADLTMERVIRLRNSMFGGTYDPELKVYKRALIMSTEVFHFYLYHLQLLQFNEVALQCYEAVEMLFYVSTLIAVMLQPFMIFWRRTNIWKSNTRPWPS